MKSNLCEHKKVSPSFDKEVADSKKLTAREVRKRWPRFSGKCPDCGQEGIFYASAEHYFYGDW
jgi:hypothetical protein